MGDPVKAAMIAKAEADLRQAEAQVVSMRAVVDWLRQTDIPQEPTAESPQADHPKGGMTNSERCLWAFEQIGGGRAPEVRAFLQQEGYEFTGTQIRNSIKYLHKTGKIHGTNGDWRLTSEIPPAVTVIPAMNGLGRES